MREKMRWDPVPQEVSEEFVNVQIPKSTWQLFHAVAEMPVTEASPAYLHQIEESMACGRELFSLPDAFVDQGAPQGTLREGKLPDSVFYPGTRRRFWVYEPAEQWRKEKSGPLPLITILDADFFLPDPETGKTKSDPEWVRVFDNLIAKGQIPPAIVLFAGYGVPGPGQPINGFSEGEVNRSLEYDTTSDWHVRFLTEELFPTALRDLPVSDDPQEHVLCGFSSSGIAAFCAAWFRPDVFGKLYLGSPSFANIRNGIVWPSVIRVSEKRPLKIFQTAGKHDLDNIFGSWFCGNLDVAHALHYAGYEHLFYLTEGGHSLEGYAYTLPGGLAWLFGGPEPVFAHMEKQTFSDVIR